VDRTSAPPQLAHQRETTHLETLAIRARSRTGRVMGMCQSWGGKCGIRRTEGGDVKPGVRAVHGSRFEKERRER